MAPTRSLPPPITNVEELLTAVVEELRAIRQLLETRASQAELTGTAGPITISDDLEHLMRERGITPPAKPKRGK